MTHTLIGLSGSLRAVSVNRKLLREAARLYGPCDYVEADLNLPLYDGDLESNEGVPASVIALAEAIRDADGVLLSTPEYNAGISGVLKNALDWISRTGIGPWAQKPVVVMSAAAGRAGGARAQTMLRSCLTPFRPLIVPGPEILIADASNQFDDQGQFKSERYEAAVTTLMENLRKHIG